MKPILGNMKIMENNTGYRAKILFVVKLNVFSEIPTDEIIFYSTCDNADIEE